LVGFEMLIPNALLIDSHPLDSKSSVVFAEPTCVELVVRHEVEEDTANSTCQQARY